MVGSNLILECLHREGADVLFGYPGGVVLPFYDKLVGAKHLLHVLVRHEENAVFAADGFARASGRVGTAMATSGPGATNMVTGLTNAMMDSIPVVALTGQVSTNLIGNDAFQEADTVGITRPCTKHNYLVKDVRELPQVLKEAFHIARTGRPGPVLVDVPKNVFLAEGGEFRYPDTLNLPGYRPTYEGHEGQIKKAVQTIWGAQRPVIYAGGGVISSGAAPLLKELAEMLQVPVGLTLMGLGGLPGDHPLFNGMLGMHGTYSANQAMVGTDLMIAIGVRFDDRVTGKLEAFAKHAKIIHIDIDPVEIGKNVTPDVPIVGDVSRVLTKLNRRVADSLSSPQGGQKHLAERQGWLERVHGWQQEHPLAYQDRDGEIMPQRLCQEISSAVDGEAIIVTDVGQHQMWGAQYIKLRHPRTWLTSGGLGAMGYGLPAAIGAQFARPDRCVVALLGDGGFQMSLPELATLVSYRLPVKVIVMNNLYLGMVRQWQELFYEGRYSAVALDVFPDAKKLGEAYGFPGRVVTRPKELRDAVRETLAEPGPVLLDVRVEREANVYPMIPAGGALADIIVDERAARSLTTARQVPAVVGGGGAGEMS